MPVITGTPTVPDTGRTLSKHPANAFRQPKYLMQIGPAQKFPFCRKDFTGQFLGITCKGVPFFLVKDEREIRDYRVIF